MTKSERAYIKRVVADTNQHIKEIYNGTLYDFMSHDQREGYIQGASIALEPFAVLVGLEVIGVDLNNMR